VFTDNDEWAALIESYRVHGKGTFKYDNVRIGMNSRLDTIQAAILQVKLRAFRDYELAYVNKVAAKYTELLKDIPGIKTPVILSDFYSSWAQYTLRLDSKERRDTLQASLKAQGIPSMVYYPTPMYLQTAFQHLASDNSHLTSATRLSETVLSLPMHPYMTDEDIQSVVHAIKVSF
jgi:dTDP-4-amino-4,6-dideoxygalactose transaminase